MTWTVPNILTLLRLLAAPGVAVMFLYFTRPWADWFALILFLFAALTDISRRLSGPRLATGKPLWGHARPDRRQSHGADCADDHHRVLRHGPVVSAARHGDHIPRDIRLWSQGISWRPVEIPARHAACQVENHRADGSPSPFCLPPGCSSTVSSNAPPGWMRRPSPGSWRATSRMTSGCCGAFGHRRPVGGAVLSCSGLPGGLHC